MAPFLDYQPLDVSTPTAGAQPFSYDFNSGMGTPQGANANMPSLLNIPDFSPGAGGATGFGSGITNFMQGDFMKGLMGSTDPKTGEQIGGWGSSALGLGKSLYGGYQAYKAGQRAEDTLSFQKDVFSKQFENQRTLINNELRDRDRARQARDPGYKSTTKFV